MAIFDKHKWIRNSIRKLSYRWPARYRAKVAARVERGKYRCSNCQQIFRDKDVELDHKEPVISVEKGFVDWNEFIDRLFVEQSEYNVLCIPCHTKKSIKENEDRRKNKIDNPEDKE